MEDSVPLEQCTKIRARKIELRPHNGQSINDDGAADVLHNYHVVVVSLLIRHFGLLKRWSIFVRPRTLHALWGRLRLAIDGVLAVLHAVAFRWRAVGSLLRLPGY